MTECISYWHSIFTPKYPPPRRGYIRMKEILIMKKWATCAIWFACFHVLSKRLSPPVDIPNVREYQYNEWLGVFEFLIEKGCRKQAYFFAFSRVIDALSMNWSLSKIPPKNPSPAGERWQTFPVPSIATHSHSFTIDRELAPISSAQEYCPLDRGRKMGKGDWPHLNR